MTSIELTRDDRDLIYHGLRCYMMATGGNISDEKLERIIRLMNAYDVSKEARDQ